ncbi:hypothetical protein FEM48_Zijuj02G0052400 [Ziziphus jujuba var. spinosa]|uniref:Fatty acid desaturase N-terminal domain-containing protein n=1 Tax=Ziziphus jujuba var. spinosa TaxID=714518 RepID=A0A978VTU5_ZIZJJ|nr:hypothetical protein FEM48_Zijuj02G0052400 [Ziziphus jujuba var. spinosa]
MQQVVEEVEASFGVDGICEDYDFDRSAPPPFKIGDIRAAIPKLARRIGYRVHHQNHGHVENDESCVPV